MQIEGSFPQWTAPYLQLYIDESGEQTIDNIRALALESFAPLAQRQPGVGNASAGYWYRWEVTLPEDPLPLLLVMGESYLNRIDLYRPDPQQPQSYRLERYGDHVPKEERSYGGRLAALELPSGGATEIWYFRIQTNSAHVFYAYLTPSQQHLHSEMGWSFWYALLIGAMLLVAALFFAFGLYLRERLFALYALYSLIHATLIANTKGYTAFIFPALYGTTIDALTGVSVILTNVVGIWLYLNVIEAKRYAPWLNRTAQIMVAAMILCLPFVTSGYYASQRVVMMIVVLPLLYWMLGLLLWKIWKGHQRMLNTLFFYAFAVSLVAVTMLHLVLLGILSFTWFRVHFFDIAYLNHIIIFSMAIIYRYHLRDRQREADHLQSHLIQERHKNQQRLFKMLTHEFRAPLSNIDKLAQLQQLQGSSQREELNSIREQCEKGFTLIDRFMHQEMTSAATPATQVKSDNCAEIITTLLQEPTLQQRLEPFKLEWSLEKEECSGIWDSELITVALRNLLENAIKYRLAKTPITLHITKQKGQLVLTLSNDSLSPGELQPLLQIGNRGKNSHNQSGEGIGLYTVKAIANAHHGLLDINYEEPHFEVKLTLPIQTEKRSGSAANG
ncbi:MAG: sensor histidine kinase [Gammaproteobacteria bacterium]|nr:sensor histidine kinase [Gammaproteobacteria bacterium]